MSKFLCRTMKRNPSSLVSMTRKLIDFRCLSSSTPLTPEEAGRRASEMAKSLLHDPQKNSSDNSSYTPKNSTVSDQQHKSLSTLLSQAGIESNNPNAPQSPPINVATTYTRPADGIYKEGDAIYARMDNPTRLLLEKTMFELECIDLPPQQHSILTQPPPLSSFAFASGLMAVSAILLAHQSPVTVILPHDLYHGTSTLIMDVFTRYSNAKVLRVDMTQTSSISDALYNIAKETTTASKEDIIVWMETPSNPKCQIIDIEAVCHTIQEIQQDESIQASVNNVTTVVDGTMSSPVLTRPFNLGVDISLHSATKYIGGHSDALLGLLTCSPITKRGKELTPIMKQVQILGGGVASPWDAWLCLRGLRTLPVRINQQCQSAQELAEYFETKKKKKDEGSSSLVTAVHYPGLKSHPQHDVARRQMDGERYGGVLSVELTNEVTATAFAGALETIHRATSLGGTETLIEHRASVEPPERRVSPPGLLRISVGLEDPKDLIRDMERALTITSKICG